MACCQLMARIRSHTARVPANRSTAAAVTPAHMKSAAVTASTPAWVVGAGSPVGAPLSSTHRDVVAGLGLRLRLDRAGVFGAGG